MRSYEKTLNNALYAYVHAIQVDVVTKVNENVSKRKFTSTEIEALRETYLGLKGDQAGWQRRADEGIFWEKHWGEDRRMRALSFNRDEVANQVRTIGLAAMALHYIPNNTSNELEAQSLLDRCTATLNSIRYST
jgi:hypothetical protein